MSDSTDRAIFERIEAVAHIRRHGRATRRAGICRGGRKPSDSQG